MAIDPSIPLMVQQPNFLNTIGQANQMAAQQNEAQHQNAFRQFMQESGPGVFRGETSALEGLSRFDPQAAFSIQSQQERLKLARAAGARAAANARLTAEQKEKSAREYEMLRNVALARENGPEAFQQALATTGLAASGVTPDNFDVYLATADGMAGELFGRLQDARPEQPNPGDRYKNVGNTLYDLYAEGGPKAVGTGASAEPSFRFVTGPDGSSTLSYGPQGGQVMDMGGLNKGEALTPEGIEIVPGSQLQREALATQAQKANKDEESLLRLGTTLESIQLNIEEIENGGLPVTGVVGEARQTGIGRALTGESAVDVQNRTNQITDSAALAEIQRMRDNSKTGGAVGQLTDSERVAIGNAVTALSTATSGPEYLRAAKAYRKLALDLAYGQGNWTIKEDTGTVQFRVKQSNAPISQMNVDDLMRLDVNTLSLEEVRQMNERLKEMGY
jgi:hypothetical protein